MNRIAQVTQVDKQMAVVALRKHTACGDCGACQLGDENMETTVKVLNPINAQVGNFVEIDMADADVLKAAFLVYIIPLAALVGTIALTQGLAALFQLNLSELVSIAIGFIMMALAFVVIKKKDQALSGEKRFISTITRVLDDTTGLSEGDLINNKEE